MQNLAVNNSWDSVHLKEEKIYQKLSYHIHTLWKGLWVVASLSLLYSLQNMLEEDQTTSRDGKVAKGKEGHQGRTFINLPPAQNWRKPTFVNSLAPSTCNQTHQSQPHTVNSMVYQTGSPSPHTVSNIGLHQNSTKVDSKPIQSEVGFDHTRVLFNQHNQGGILAGPDPSGNNFISGRSCCTATQTL